jgi:hypothetical protein
MLKGVKGVKGVSVNKNGFPSPPIFKMKTFYPPFFTYFIFENSNPSKRYLIQEKLGWLRKKTHFFTYFCIQK